jgi:hypothetical protein
MIGLSADQQADARAILHAVHQELQRPIKVLVLHPGIDGFSTNGATLSYLKEGFGPEISFSITAMCPGSFQEKYHLVFITRDHFAWTHQETTTLHRIFQPDPNDEEMLARYPSPTRWAHWLHLMDTWKQQRSIS